MDNNGEWAKKGAQFALPYNSSHHLIRHMTLIKSGWRPRWIYALDFISLSAARSSFSPLGHTFHLKGGVHHRVSFETRPKYSDKFNHFFRFSVELIAALFPRNRRAFLISWVVFLPVPFARFVVCFILKRWVIYGSLIWMGSWWFVSALCHFFTIGDFYVTIGFYGVRSSWL